MFIYTNAMLMSQTYRDLGERFAIALFAIVLCQEGDVLGVREFYLHRGANFSFFVTAHFNCYGKSV